MQTLKATNLGVKFVLELVAFAAFAYWGASVGGTALPVLLAIVAPVVAIVLWGTFAAPRSGRRLPLAARVAFELCVFGLAVVALLAAGSQTLAIVFAVAVVVNAALLTVFGQLDR